jgi:hypothetical protein
MQRHINATVQAASVAAITRESDAPVGTLDHRTGSRDAPLSAAWLRPRCDGRTSQGPGSDGEPVRVRVVHGLGAVAGADLGEYVIDVRLDGRLADHQHGCDLAV